MNLYLKPNLVTVQNVSLGNTWSADLPIGPAYDFIDVIVTMTSASGKTLSSLADFLGQITVNVNGKSVRTHLATELDAVQTAYGSNYAALLFNSTGTSNTLLPVISSGLPQAPQSASQTTAILRIHFQEPWRKTWAGASYRRFYTSWAKTAKSPAQVLSSFQIQGAIPRRRTTPEPPRSASRSPRERRKSLACGMRKTTRSRTCCVATASR